MLWTTPSSQPLLKLGPNALYANARTLRAYSRNNSCEWDVTLL
jgi:hypothetical protein